MAALHDTEVRPAPTAKRWYALDPDGVASTLGVAVASGLTAEEAAARLRRDGPNALPVEEPPSALRRFLGQYTSYMQLILVGASVVSLIIKEWSTAIVLALISVFNAVGGLRQQGKAESAMNALQSMMQATARVRRGGVESEVSAEELVVGDVVIVTAGDEVPADGRIVTSSALQIDESALTGESVPADKDATTLSAGELGPGEQSNMVFMHTPVTHGSAVIVVTATGGDTEMGKIAHMLSATAAEETPLTKQMNALTLWIVGAAGVTMIVMFALGASRGQSWETLFDTAVALAIAAIPLALPMVVQVVLSLGSVELAKEKAIVKDLPSVETLGFTSAINSDKTGTLTMNQMTAVEVVSTTDRYAVSGTGYDLQGTITHPAGRTDSLDGVILPYVVASDATLVEGKVVGDPTEGALLVLAHKAGMFIDATREQLPRLATLPFDPSYKLMATFNRTADASGRAVVRCFVKGAAPAVMERASTALADGASVVWDEDLRRRAQAQVERLGEAGLRVMAGAYRDIEIAAFDAEGDLLAYVEDLEVTSLVGMVDPPRPESKAAVADAQAAHIRVRMVTGDDVVTGAAVAKQLGIQGDAILGAEFAALAEEERLARIDDIGVVGRVAPEHKVLLAETLKKKGHVVAMTGDGVNDAPAIKAADIGVAMGSGTEVAKNAGRMILSDDNFATIVYAVEQGRKLYDNLNKYIRFVLLELVAFVLTFLGATLVDIAGGQPFTPAQILWINFLVNAPFGVALGFDQETPGLMTRRPRPRGESILTTGVMVTCGLVGLYVAGANLAMIAVGKNHLGSVLIGQSMGLVAFTLMLVVAAFEARSEQASALSVDSFTSVRMNLIAVAEIAGAFLVTQADFMRRLLGTTRLTGGQWGLALLAAVVLLLLWELGKAIARRRSALTTSTSTPAPAPAPASAPPSASASSSASA
ncbi:MAG TPA: HAD-IC family P-type ATPase [Acidimicrobiales bacterium]|nr:HAD-IC family P-type ATPase [Acidimicrobiales bacterium]